MVWSHRCVIVAEREEAPNRAASPCEHGLLPPLCPRVSSISPRPSISSHPNGASLPSCPEHVRLLLAVRSCWGVGWGNHTCPGERWQLFLPAEWSWPVREESVVVWSHPCVFLAEREEAANGATSPVTMGSPFLSAQESLVSHRACLCPVMLKELTAILSRACHRPACCGPEWGMVWDNLTCPGERWQLFLPAEWWWAESGECAVLWYHRCVTG